jgi:hypothetical protein
VSTSNVKISLSVDSGHTYPYVLAGSTPNDGAEPVVLPMVGTTHARVKIEAIDNVFFDVSNADFAITWPFTGFFSPVGNPPALKSPNAGSAVPVKFSLGGDRGLAILEAGYPASRKIDCTSGAPLGPLQPTTSADGLTYANGQYSSSGRPTRAGRERVASCRCCSWTARSTPPGSSSSNPIAATHR